MTVFFEPLMATGSLGTSGWFAKEWVASAKAQNRKTAQNNVADFMISSGQGLFEHG